MIEYRKGSVFDAIEPNKNIVLCHATNCKGRWGSGVAKSFKEFFPQSFKQYETLCLQYGPSLLGTTQFVRESNDSNIYIACLFTSDGYADTLDPEYMILHNTESAVKQLFELSGGVNVHMPKKSTQVCLEFLGKKQRLLLINMFQVIKTLQYGSFNEI